MRHSSRLTLEYLEDRLTPANYGNPWPDAAHLSLSFVPDGTTVGNSQSVLFSELNAKASTADWQLAMLRALQTWAVKGNINVGLSPDGGQAVGSRGAIQSDSRFGDIRVNSHSFAAVNAGIEDVALGSSYDPTAGTWAGDVQLNSQEDFGLGGQGKYDLYSVALHEFGHVLGIGHSPNASSVMYDKYTGIRTDLSAEDIAALQSLYGARSPDSFEGSRGNDSVGAASPLNALNSLNLGDLTLKATGDLTTLQDKDYYQFRTSLSTGAMLIQLKTSGISSLAARVSVYDSAQNLVAYCVASGPTNGNMILQIPNAKSFALYTLKVDSMQGDVFAIGSYELSINGAPLLSSMAGVLTGWLSGTTDTLLNVDLHTNDSFATALNLQQLTGKTDSRFDQAFQASIGDSWDVDIYRIQAPTSSQSTNVLTAMVWPLKSSKLLPNVTVYDSYQTAIAAQVLVNDAGNYTVQVPNAVPGATYYVKVAAADSQSNNVGNYFLGVDFGTKAIAFNQFASGTLDQAQWQGSSSVSLNKAQVFHLALTVKSANPDIESALRLTIYDAAGKIMASFVAKAGETTTRDIFLPRGKYVVRYAARTKTGVALPKLNYSIDGTSVSDPVGPEPSDSTMEPSSGGGTGSGGGWTGGGGNNGLSPQDPYSDPYGSC